MNVKPEIALFDAIYPSTLRQAQDFRANGFDWTIIRRTYLEYHSANQLSFLSIIALSAANGFWVALAA